jgi:hypothetical protein
MVVAKTSHTQNLKSGTGDKYIPSRAFIGDRKYGDVGIFKCRTNIGFNEMASSGICAEL